VAIHSDKGDPMSADGRARDALWGLLDGYGLEDEDVGKIAEDVIAVIAPIYMELGERVGKSRLLAEMTKRGISLGDPK
jgi:hypothetical protein